MSFLQKQKEWTDYLNAIIAHGNPFLSDGAKQPDNALVVDKESVSNETVQDALEEANKEEKRVFDEMESAGTAAISRGESESKSASAKSSALYDLLRGFTAKQESRYDRLIAEIERGDYLASDAAKSIIDSYSARGREAAGHAAAEAAAANGGNPDTYAATQANRQRLAFEEAGQAAAREYYSAYLDRMLSALRASSADIGGLYGGLQDNIEASDKRASDNLSIGAELLSALAAAQEKSKESTLEALSELAKDEEKKTTVSPMEVDLTYNALLTEKVNGKPRYTPTAALMVLWKRFPTMHEYIAEKYADVVGPHYTFDG